MECNSVFEQELQQEEGRSNSLVARDMRFTC